MKSSPDSNTQGHQDDTPRSRQSLGTLLKEGRKAKGKSLEEISQATGIGLSKLQALENGERRGLPADIFVRGFIRMISAQINIDSQTALELFEREWGGRETSDDTSLLQGEAFAKSSVILRRWPAFLSILILGTMIYLAAKFLFPALFIVPTQPLGEILSNELPEIKIVSNEQEQKPPEIVEENSATPVTNAPDDTQEYKKKIDRNELKESMPTVIIEQVQAPAESEPAEPLTDRTSEVIEANLTDPLDSTVQQDTADVTTKSIPDMSDEVTHYTLNLKFNERTWVKISLDGQEAQEEIFKRNSEKTWDADKSIDLYLGNAGGVKVTLNGEPMPLKQESGQTVRLQIP
nr:DUF4115 domain-containing protein [Desulfobulbaceae bacterium]